MSEPSQQMRWYAASLPRNHQAGHLHLADGIGLEAFSHHLAILMTASSPSAASMA